MKHINKMLLAPLLALSMAAQAGDKVTVVTTTGAKAYDISTVERINVGGDALSVVCSDGNSTTYAFDEVTRIVISGDATAISEVSADDNAQLTLSVAADGTWMRVNGWDNTQTTALSIFTTNGQTALCLDSWHGGVVDIAALPHGIYVVKAGQHTAKFRK